MTRVSSPSNKNLISARNTHCVECSSRKYGWTTVGGELSAWNPKLEVLHTVIFRNHANCNICFPSFWLQRTMDFKVTPVLAFVHQEWKETYRTPVLRFLKNGWRAFYFQFLFLWKLPFWNWHYLGTEDYLCLCAFIVYFPWCSHCPMFSNPLRPLQDYANCHLDRWVGGARKRTIWLCFSLEPEM